MGKASHHTRKHEARRGHWFSRLDQGMGRQRPASSFLGLRRDAVYDIQKLYDQIPDGMMVVVL